MSDQTVHTAFELPALPYGLQDLEPHLGEETLKVHHGRHHAKYVENLNRLLAGQDLAGVSLEGVLRRASESNQTALFNNAAQTWNHAFFWESMSARSSVPDGQLAQACLGRFGSLNNLREQFISEGVGHFGSGWVWLVSDGAQVSIVSTPNQDTPLADGLTPLLGADVWEHAYYLKYQNKRPDYLEAFFNVVNWDYVNERFAAAQG